MTLSSIRARILLGRPGGVYGHVNDDTLMDVVARIVAAYEKADAPSPWAFHLLMLRHDGKWAEQLVHVDLDGMDVGSDAATYCAATVLDIVMRMKECNAVHVDAVREPVAEKPAPPKSQPAAKKPAIDKSGQLGLGL